jgi:hypothetical protein
MIPKTKAMITKYPTYSGKNEEESFSELSLSS